LLNFAGAGKTFPHHSAADVLSGAVPAAQFKDSIVFISATATGIFDLRVTPYATVFPGGEIHANAVENILGQTFLQRPPWVEIVAFGLVLVLPFGCGVFLHRLRPVGGSILAVLTLGGLLGLTLGLFALGGLWFPVIYPMLAVAAT